MAAMATRAATINIIKFLLVRNASLALTSMRINSIKLVLVNIIKAYGIHKKNGALNNLLQQLLRIL